MSTNHNIKRSFITMSIASLALSLLVAADGANPFSREAVLSARLAMNEANDNPLDAAAITYVRKRSAVSHGRTLEAELIALHHRRSLRPDRATHPRRGDNRPWIGDLNAELTQPHGWPTTMTPWERMAPRWRRLLEVTQGAIDGTVPDPCQGHPVTWGGPRVDHHRITRMVAKGWERASCGETANVFMIPPSRETCRVTTDAPTPARLATLE